MPRRASLGFFLFVSLLLPAVSHSSGVCPALPPDAVGWWPAEDSAQDILGTNTGSLVNGTGFAAGKVGQAFNFDGVNDYVDIPDAPGIFFGNDQSFTLESWFMPMSDAPSYFVLKNAGYGIRWQGHDQPLLFYNGNNHYSSRTSWAIGQWYHVVIVDDGASSVKLYVDGILDRSDEGAARNPNRFACRPGFGYCFSLQFGAWYEPQACSGNCIEFFTGLVDEVTLYGRALSSAEIEGLFLAGSQGKCPIEDKDGDGWPVPEDCDDFDPSVFPQSAETYDAKDNDCDGLVDEGLDDDHDGVPNFYDACPGTPPGGGIDPRGCPVCGKSRRGPRQVSRVD